MCTEDSRAPLKKVPPYLRPPTESFQRKLSIEPTFEARRQLRHIFFVKKLPTKTKLNETKIQNFVYFGSHAHPGVL